MLLLELLLFSNLLPEVFLKLSILFLLLESLILLSLSLLTSNPFLLLNLCLEFGHLLLK